MADDTLPEGTDTIVSGEELGGANGGSTGDSTTTNLRNAGGSAGSSGDSASSATSTGGGGVREALRTGSDKLRSTASEKAMGFVGQGLERSSDALNNVSTLIGDTAQTIDDRLGTQYGDYARSAAQTIERTAASLSSKSPEELVDDARELIRKSPGVALAGAAIVGFALARLVKAGLDDNNAGRSTGGRRNDRA